MINRTNQNKKLLNVTCTEHAKMILCVSQYFWFVRVISFTKKARDLAAYRGA